MNHPPVLLCVDSGSPTLLVAVTQGDTVRSTVLGDSTQGHGTAIIPLMEQALAQAGLTLAQCDVLAVALGPGSFTGLRTSVATLKGMALGLGKPLLGVSTLHALARSVEPRGVVTGALDARKREVYAAVYRTHEDAAQDVVLVPPWVGAAADWAQQCGQVGPTGWAGDGAALLGETTPAWPHAYPKATALAQLALTLLPHPPPLGAVEPFYVRQSYAQLFLVKKG